MAGRKPIGDRPMTRAELQARVRQRRAERLERQLDALRRILRARSIERAHAIAQEVLEQEG